MATTVIGIFENSKSLHQAINELAKAGLKDQDIEILEGDARKVEATVAERGFEDEDVRGYAEAVKAGKKLLAAFVPEAKAEQVVAIMDRYESANGEERRGSREESVPVVEEELSVTKRQVGRGGVRVSTRVSEKPVEKTVRLREEEVEVERKKAGRELSPEEAERAFKEWTVEVTATGEEVEVEKEARVVGEVSVGKQVHEREEKVQDTVRRTEVEVEKVGSKARKAS
jgi:uncharacterized protein (TIGR02271 family)